MEGELELSGFVCEEVVEVFAGGVGGGDVADLVAVVEGLFSLGGSVDELVCEYKVAGFVVFFE